MPGHVLICRHCGRTFATKRSDAIGCSRSCRRHLAKAAQAPTQAAAVVSPMDDIPPPVEDEELNGWRRIGGFLVPPADPRNVFRIG
jgi:hypothetical protein